MNHKSTKLETFNNWASLNQLTESISSSEHHKNARNSLLQPILQTRKRDFQLKTDRKKREFQGRENKQVRMPGAEVDPPSMAVAPPKRIKRGPRDLVAATAVSV